MRLTDPHNCHELRDEHGEVRPAVAVKHMPRQLAVPSVALATCAGSEARAPAHQEQGRRRRPAGAGSRGAPAARQPLRWLRTVLMQLSH